MVAIDGGFYTVDYQYLIDCGYITIKTYCGWSIVILSSCLGVSSCVAWKLGDSGGRVPSITAAAQG